MPDMSGLVVNCAALVGSRFGDMPYGSIYTQGRQIPKHHRTVFRTSVSVYVGFSLKA